MKIGIDFGSTYSTVSKYNPVNDSVEALHLEEGAPVSIPSAVSISTRKLRYVIFSKVTFSVKKTFNIIV